MRPEYTILIALIFFIVVVGGVGGYTYYKRHKISNLHPPSKERFGGGHSGGGGRGGGGGGHSGGGRGGGWRGGYWGGTGKVPDVVPGRRNMASWYGEYGGYGGDAYGGWWGSQYDWYFNPAYYLETVPINTTSDCNKGCLDNYKKLIDGGMPKTRAAFQFEECIASCSKIPYNQIGAY